MHSYISTFQSKKLNYDVTFVKFALGRGGATREKEAIPGGYPKTRRQIYIFIKKQIYWTPVVQYVPGQDERRRDEEEDENDEEDNVVDEARDDGDFHDDGDLHQILAPHPPPPPQEIFHRSETGERRRKKARFT